MTISIKHAFVSLKGDGGDATQVQPSYWNASHSTSMASGQLIGRLTAGAGAFEEIPISAYMAGLLAAADAAGLAAVLGLFETGDVKYTFRTAASAGWLLMLGGTGSQFSTIGNAVSNAVLRANNDTLPLYTIIWNGCDNSIAPIYDSAGNASTRGANANADFIANKRLAVPSPVGKAPVGAGVATNSPLATSTRLLGAQFGTETHTLVANQIPTITSVNAAQAISVNSPSFLYSLGGIAVTVSTPGSGAYGTDGGHPPTNTVLTSTGNNSISTTYTNASQQSVLNFQPSIALNCMVKL